MISKDELIGTWQLESWAIGYADRDEFTYPYGEEPAGLLVYSNDGWMSASINRPGRALLPAGRELSQAARCAQGEGFFLVLSLRGPLPGGGR